MATFITNLIEAAHWLPTFESESTSFEVTMSWLNEDRDAERRGELDNATVLDILDAPEGYYVNYHTEDHPNPGTIGRAGRPARCPT